MPNSHGWVVALASAALAALSLGAGPGTAPVLSASRCVPAPANLRAWWPADGNSADVVGGHPSRLEGNAGFASGVVGQAFRFDGSGDYVRSPDSPNWNLGDHGFSLVLWVRFTAGGGRQSFISHDEGGGELRKWIFWYDTQGHRLPFGPALRFHINSPDQGPLDPLAYPWEPVPGRWYHLALTRSPNSVDSPSVYRLYIDGALVMAETDSHTIRDAAAPLRIGFSEPDFFLNGALDEVMIIHRRISAAEVATLNSSPVCRP